MAGPLANLPTVLRSLTYSSLRSLAPLTRLLKTTTFSVAMEAAPTSLSPGCQLLVAALPTVAIIHPRDVPKNKLRVCQKRI